VVPETAHLAQTVDAVLPNGIRLTIHPGTAMPHLVAVIGALSRLGAAC
jgi:hypothetical protein